jgi:hypothetical protein
MTTPFAFDMWNYVWMQFATFATIFIMIAYARAATRRRPLERVIFTAAAIVVVLVQVIVLARGSAQVRSWDDTEFREMFIAFGMLAYAFETSAVLWRCRCGWAPDR